MPTRLCESIAKLWEVKLMEKINALIWFGKFARLKITNDSHTVEEDTCDQFITDGSSCSQFLSFKEEIFPTLPAFSKFFPYAISNEILFEIEGNTTMCYNYGIKYFFLLKIAK